MRHSALSVTTLVIILSCCIARENPAGVRFDGLYCHESDEFIQRTFDYLRFYPDGVVISTAATDRPGEVVTWFDRDHPGLEDGRYQIADGLLRFTLKTHSGWTACTGQ